MQESFGLNEYRVKAEYPQLHMSAFTIDDLFMDAIVS